MPTDIEIAQKAKQRLIVDIAKKAEIKTSELELNGCFKAKINLNIFKRLKKNKTGKLILGRTASEIKSTIGAEAVELKCYIRHHNPLSNRIIKPFVEYLKPAAWIPRNPFKENDLQPAMVQGKG